MARYTINNIEMIGSTTLLGLLDKSQALMPWAAKNTVEYIDKKTAFFKDENGNLICRFTVEEFESLLNEAKGNYRKVSKEACDIGSEVHDIISQYIMAKINNDYFDPTAFKIYRKEVENGFLAFLEWEKENIIEYIESESPVASLKYCFAGTLDLIARLQNGKIYVIDFKSSKAFYDGYAKQIASYKLARMERKSNDRFFCKFKGNDYNYEKVIIQKPLNIEGIGILRLDKETGLPEWRDYSKHYERKRDSFLKLLDFYYLDKVRQLKNNPRVIKKYTVPAVLTA